MIVQVGIEGLKKTTWHEYVVRFVFGGLISAATGAIGEKWGPVIAGLFLAFPAIFPASATLIQKHERQRKERHGLRGEQRGMEAAADDAMGTAMGSMGLAVFAVIGWLWLRVHSPVLTLAAATAGWASMAVVLWIFRKRRRMIFGRR
jgi:hypothetical protein